MSEIKVNKLTPRTNCGTVTLGDSGDTFTIPSGATISNLGTATGFGGTGVVSWDTASIKTTGFTAVTGTGYFCNTTGGGFTVTLPASPTAGDVVGVSDYAKTFATYNLTLGRNSEKIGGDADNATLNSAGTAVTLVYVDSTKGWIVTDSGNQTDAPGPLFVTATGGCITTSGDYKIHTFLSPNTFCVTCGGNSAGSQSVDYMVIAGGGGGGNKRAGGGGAGGYRESNGTASGCYTVSPLATTPTTVPAIAVTVQGYPIIVGGGGAGGSAAPASPAGTVNVASASGDVSTFDSVTSAGGGTGGGMSPNAGPCGSGKPGGSGGGGFAGDPSPGSHSFPASTAGGVGNTPPVTPPQGNTGGVALTSPSCSGQAGGGGGATQTGYPGCQSQSPTTLIAKGGDGATSSINATPTARAGGGGGGGRATAWAGPGGAGGGGNGGNAAPGGTAGTINTGSGGGGMSDTAGNSAGNGGSGIVIIRYKYQ